MKANFMFVIAAMMLNQNVIAIPVEDTIEVIEPVELRNETELHTVELEDGQEQVEVHHGRFRVRLKFKDYNSTSTSTIASPTSTPTSSSTVETTMSSHRNRNRNRGGRS